MCSLVILRRPGHAWPLLVAANRDELISRPSLPPARHWPDRPEVVAGLDVTGGGSWLGLNDHGVVAAVLNREGTLGPAAGKRSRGELVLEALDHAEASAAAGALADLHPDAYRPFNLVIADPRDGYWLRHGGDGDVRVHRIPEGLHLIASGELDDLSQPRVRRFLPLFRAAPEPMTDPADGPDSEPGSEQAPETGVDPAGWAYWIALLQRRDFDPADGPAAAMTLELAVAGDTFATVASSLIAVPAYPGFAQVPLWRHAQGAPDRARFEAVPL